MFKFLSLFSLILPLSVFASYSTPKHFLTPNYAKNTLCYDQAGKRHNVDPALLKAVAKMETDEMRVKMGKDGVEQGILALNLRFASLIAKHQVSIKDLTDPCYSLHLGAYAYRQALDKTKDPKQALKKIINVPDFESYYQKIQLLKARYK